MWTRFMDMHSGGGCKLDVQYIYIELPQNKAEIYFEQRFDRNPMNITCDCCGEDYSISEYKTLENATAFERGVYSFGIANDPIIPLTEYKKKKDILIIGRKEINHAN